MDYSEMDWNQLYDELLKASRQGNLGNIRRLAQYFEDPEGKSNVYSRPIVYASEYGRLPVLRYLVEHDATLIPLYTLALEGAARKGHLNVVKYLVEDVIEKTYVTGNYTGAIISAFHNRHMDIVNYLRPKTQIDRKLDNFLYVNALY